MNRNLVWLSARAAVALALAALTAACTGGDADETQSIEGQVARSNFEASVLGVRAVRGGEAVAWAPLTANGHFRLRVPVGEDYRLEVVTASGAHPFVGKSGEGGRNLVFDVCGAGEAFDVGHVHGWERAGGGSDGEPGGGGGCDDPCMNDPSGCDDSTKPPGCVERRRGTSSRQRSADSSARPLGSSSARPCAAARPASSSSAPSDGSA